MTTIRVAQVADLLRRSTSVVVDATGNQRPVTEILKAGEELARSFLAAGVSAGDRVAVQLPNTMAYLDLLAAAAVGRFVVMSVNLRFAEPLAASLIERSGAVRVIRSSVDGGDAVEGVDAVDGAGGPGQLLPEPSPEDRYVIFTTSGTTSQPKLVVHQHRSIATHAADVADAFGYDEESVVLLGVPLCGVFGFSILWGAIAGHSTIVMPERFEPAETAQLVERYGVTSLHGSDDLFHRLLATPADLSSIETAGYARFNTALDGIVERCDARGIPLSGLYGMSEVQALYAWRDRRPDEPPVDLDDRWRPGGRLVSDAAHCRVVDDELQLRGPSLFEGYLADGGEDLDADLTAANFDDGWFRTGDLAEIDGDRSFEYITRMGDVMRVGGFLVAPVEVETVLMELPAVEQAQVVAVGLESGARPVGFVIAPDGIEEDAAIEHCRERLARFKCPVRIVAVDAFPVTDGPNGIKIQRAKLRDMAKELFV